MDNEVLTVTQYGTTVEELVWKRMRKRSPDLTNDVLAANPGLAALGHHLPIGTKVILPVKQANIRSSKAPVRLWD